MAYNHRNGLGCALDDLCECGFRLVTDAYVDAVAPETPIPFPNLGPGPEEPGPAQDEWLAKAEANIRHAASVASRRSAAANSVYPCPNCNPEQFLRWQAGAWPYPARDGSKPVANEPPSDDEGLFSELALPYRDDTGDF